MKRQYQRFTTLHIPKYTLIGLSIGFIVPILIFIELINIVKTHPVAAQSSSTICYSVSDRPGSSELFVYSASTWSHVGDTNVYGIEAIAYNPRTRILYTANNDDFGSLDFITGSFTSIGVPVGSISLTGSLGNISISDIDGLTFNPFTGELWASERRQASGEHDLLFQIDPLTGQALTDTFGVGIDYVPIEEFSNFFDVDDIAMDPYDGALYAISNRGSIPGALTIVDKTDGTISHVGNFGIPDLEGLGFYNDGYLYGTTGDNAFFPGSMPDRHFLISTTTAITTPLALIDPTVGGEEDFEAMDCLTGEPNLITGTVYTDANINLNLDLGEIGTPNVTVNLFRDANMDGIYNPGTDIFLTSVDTNAAGGYEFEIASTGNFVLTIDEATLPAGHGLTTDNLEVAIFNGVGLVEPNNNFGHIPASIGDYVWEDLDHDGFQDAGEPGIAGVTVVLYDATSTPIMTTTTNASGIYTFTNLLSAGYSVGFIPPAGYYISPLDQVGDTFDSDAAPSTGRTITTTLALGEHDPTWDAGVFLADSDIMIVKSVSTERTVPNQTAVLTYTLSVTNTGNVPLNPVNATDTLPIGLTYVPASAIPAETSLVGQTLSWNDVTSGVDFNPGDNLQIVFQATLTNTNNSYINYTGVEGTVPSGPSFPSEIVDDTDDVTVVVEDPSVALNKEFIAPGIVDGVITYTINITNTGPSTIDVLPLFDTFSGPMGYIGGTPAADTVNNLGGSLVWNDLTTIFGDIAPGQVITIETVFQITTSATEVTIINGAQVQNGLDSFSNPTNEPQDTVTLVNIPTAVELVSFSTSSLGNRQVRVDWATASEVDNFGFHVYRSQIDDFATATKVHFEPSAVSGGTGTGTLYQFIDTVPNYGIYYYWLEDVETSGETAVSDSASILVNQLFQTFIPIIHNK